jgi:hypothetical protein
MRSYVLSFSLFCPLYAQRFFLPSPQACVPLTRGGRGARRQSRAERQQQMACPTRSARQRPTTPESASDRSGSSVHPLPPTTFLGSILWYSQKWRGSIGRFSQIWLQTK